MVKERSDRGYVALVQDFIIAVTYSATTQSGIYALKERTLSSPPRRGISTCGSARGPRLAASPKQGERRDAGATGDSRRKSNL
jgi:hypothetical protein